MKKIVFSPIHAQFRKDTKANISCGPAIQVNLANRNFRPRNRTMCETILGLWNLKITHWSAGHLTDLQYLGYSLYI